MSFRYYTSVSFMVSIRSDTFGIYPYQWSGVHQFSLWRSLVYVRYGLDCVVPLPTSCMWHNILALEYWWIRRIGYNPAISLFRSHVCQNSGFQSSASLRVHNNFRVPTNVESQGKLGKIKWSGKVMELFVSLKSQGIFFKYWLYWNK